MASVGVNKVRLTGGEPLVRHNLAQLVEMLAAIDGIEDLALTTNGILLAEQAEGLRRAGLDRLNISLDALREETFQKISRRSGLDQILLGIDAAKQLGFRKIRLNAVAIAGQQRWSRPCHSWGMPRIRRAQSNVTEPRGKRIWSSKKLDSM